MVIIWCLVKRMVDGTFLQIHIQVQWLVQHVICEQMHCAKVGVPRLTFLDTSLQRRQAVCAVSQHEKFL